MTRTTPTSTTPPSSAKGPEAWSRRVSNPRPSPEPGPLPPLGTATREVHGHARDGVVIVALLAVLLASPLSAQVIPTGTPAADILLSQAIAEHRVFLTCSALDPVTHQQILTDWQKDTAAAVAILTAQNTPPDAITAFTKAADPAALMPSDDTPWAEIKGLCDTQPDWLETYQDRDLTILDQNLPGVFQ